MAKDTNNHVFLLTTIILAVVFFYSGFSKIVLSDIFIDNLQTWSILPDLAIPILLFGIPFIELVGAIWLSMSLTDWRPRAYLAALLLIFTLTVVIEYSLSGSVSCGCFGEKVKNETNISALLFRNSLLLIAALVHPSILKRAGIWKHE